MIQPDPKAVTSWIENLGFTLYEFEDDDGQQRQSWMKDGAIQIGMKMAAFFYAAHHTALTSFRDEVLAAAPVDHLIQEDEDLGDEYSGAALKHVIQENNIDFGRNDANELWRKTIQTISERHGI